MPGNPDHKKKVDGKELDGDIQRMAKSRKVTGRSGQRKRTEGTGAQELGTRRMLGDIFRDDEDEE